MIIDRLTTLLDFEIDRKALNEHKKRLKDIVKLTKDIGRTAAQESVKISEGVGRSSRSYRAVRAEIKRNIVKLESLRQKTEEVNRAGADSNTAKNLAYQANLRAKNIGQTRKQREELIAVWKAQIAINKGNQEAIINHNKEKASIEALIRAKTKERRAIEAIRREKRSSFQASIDGSRKENLELKKTNHLLITQRALWGTLGNKAVATMGRLAHRISRTASVLIRFRNLLGVTIAGAIGLREVGAIATEGFDLERARLAIGSFGGKEGETKEDKSKRVEVTMREIEDIALATPFGLGKSESVFLDLTRKGIDASKYTQGFINTAAKFGANDQQITNAVKQLGDGFANNRLTTKDFRTINENKIPMSEALIAVLGDPSKTKLENLGTVSKALTNGDVGIEVLNKVMDFFNEQGAIYGESQKENSFFQLDQLQDFKKIFRRTIAKSGFRENLASVIREINEDLTIARIDGGFDSAAKSISDFLVQALRKTYLWLKKTVTKLKEGEFWFQKVANAMGGYAEMVKGLIKLGLAAWLAPLLILFAQLAAVIYKTGFGFGKFAGIVYLAYTALSFLINHLDKILEYKTVIAGIILAIGAAVLVLGKSIQKAIAGQLLWSAFNKGAVKGKAGILAFLGPVGQVAAAILILADNWDFVIKKLESYKKRMLESGGIVKGLHDTIKVVGDVVGGAIAKKKEKTDFVNTNDGGSSLDLDYLANFMNLADLKKANEESGGSSLKLTAAALKQSRTPEGLAAIAEASAPINTTNNNNVELKVITTSKDTAGIGKDISALLPEVLEQMSSGVVVQ